LVIIPSKIQAHESGPSFCMNDISKLCNAFRVKYDIEFMWEASSENGIWLLTKDRLSSDKYEILNDEAERFYGFKFVEWVFTSGQLNIKIEHIVA
jgi:hypothetical protein